MINIGQKWRELQTPDAGKYQACQYRITAGAGICPCQCLSLSWWNPNSKESAVGIADIRSWRLPMASVSSARTGSAAPRRYLRFQCRNIMEQLCWASHPGLRIHTIPSGPWWRRVGWVSHRSVMLTHFAGTSQLHQNVLVIEYSLAHFAPKRNPRRLPKCRNYCNV